MSTDKKPQKLHDEPVVEKSTELIGEAPSNSFKNLSNVSVQEMLQLVKFLPKDAEKFVHILERDHFRPPRNVEIDNQLDNLKDVPLDKLSTELTKFIPTNPHQYKELLDTLPMEQVQDIVSWVNLAKKHQIKQDNTYRHTVGGFKFMSELFDTNNPVEAEKEIQSASKNRLQSWFNSSIHFLTVSAAEEEFNVVRQCLSTEHNVSALPSIRKPCVRPMEAAKAKMAVIDKRLNNECGHYLNEYKKAMFETKNYNDVQGYWKSLVSCTSEETRILKERAIISSRPYKNDLVGFIKNFTGVPSAKPIDKEH